MSYESISATEMKIIDINCKYRGISPLILMENAGSAIARKSFSILNSNGSSKTNRLNCFNVVFFAGKGNNGGDAFVAARHMAGLSETDDSYTNNLNDVNNTNNLNDIQIQIHVVCLYSECDIKTPESKLNFNLIKNIPSIDIIFLDRENENLSNIKKVLKSANLIIDALSGTGFSGNLRIKESIIISLINEYSSNFNIPVLSVDVPSGVDSNCSNGFSGASNFDSSNSNLNKLKEIPINATSTVTFHKMKTFLENPLLKDKTGDISVFPIGIPKTVERFVGPGHFLNLSKKNPLAHKGDSGKVLIIGGGSYTGAPFFSAVSALKAGSDIVTVATPAAAANVISSYSPDLIVKTLPGNSKFLCEDDVPYIKELIKSHDSVVIGPGLGDYPETKDAIISILSFCKRAVIDADAIISEIKTLDFSDKQFVFTPHKGEFKRFCSNLSFDSSNSDLSFDASDSTFDLNFNSSDFSEQFLSDLFLKLKDVSKICGNSAFIFKGPIDIVFSSEKMLLNDTGNSEMSVGGTGDILAGITGSILAKNNSFDAAACSAFLAGLAGDITLENTGPGLLASDIVSNISKARIKIDSYIS